MRLGIAGCGRIAERGYLPAAQAIEGVTIAALADPNPERLERCLRLWRDGGGEAQGFADPTKLLASEAIDLLVVAAPPDRHVDLTEQAAAAGVRSLVEKPPAPDLAGALRLAALDQEPVLAFNRRFLQGAELREAIPAAGWIELDLELRFRQSVWDAHEARDEALLDAGIHLIDLACFLSGAAPIAVRDAEITPRRASFELELTRGRARIRCATDRRHREAVVIRDRGGSLVGRSRWGGMRARIGRALGETDPLLLSLTRQLEALRDSAPQLQHPLHPAEVEGAAVGGRKRSVHLPNAADGVAVMAVVEAARCSAELTGAEVTVTPGAEVQA